MATVTVRNLDDEVRRLLRIRAAKNDRSMEAEVRDILAKAVASSATRTRTRTTRTPPVTRHTGADQGVASLTSREHTVGRLVAQGLSNRAIASHLYLSERTVESHVSAILGKLGLRSRAGVAARLAAVTTTR